MKLSISKPRIATVSPSTNAGTAMRKMGYPRGPTGDDFVVGAEPAVNDRCREQRRNRQRIGRHRRLEVGEHVRHLAHAQPVLGVAAINRQSS